MPGLELLGLDLGGRRRGVREHEDPRVREAPPPRDLGEVRARDDDRRRRPERARPSRLERATGALAAPWNSSSVPVEEAVAPRALVRGVGDELRDERAPRGGRRGRGGGVRRGRVDDVGRAGRPRSPQRHLAVAERKRQPARDDLDLARPLGRLAVTHRDDADGVAARDEEAREVRPVRRRAADVRRPDACEKSDAHARQPARRAPDHGAYHSLSRCPARFHERCGGRRATSLSPSSSSPSCCACFAHATSRASTSAWPGRPSRSALPTSRSLATAVLAALRLRARRTLPSPWLLAATAAFALLIVASAIPNGADALTAAGKLAEFAALTLGAAAFLDTRDRLGALAELLVAFTVVAVFWGAVGFVGGAGGRQGSFLGEHDLAALGTMALAVGLARIHSRTGRPGLCAIVAIVGGRPRDHARRVSREPARPLSRRRARVLGLALARHRLRLGSRSRDARRRGRRDRGDALAPQRRARLPPGVVRPGAGAARPVRGELEPAPDLRVRRRPRLSRPARSSAPAGTASCRRRSTRATSPDARERFSGPAAELLPAAASGTFIPQQTYDQVLFELGLVGAAAVPRRRCCWPRGRRCGPAFAGPATGAWARAGVRAGRLARRPRRRARRRGALRGRPARRDVLAHPRRRRGGARSSSRACQRMTIVHVIARLNVGGAALHVLQLAREQQRRGHDVVVVAGTLAAGEESMEYVADELGVAVRALPALQRELSRARRRRRDPGAAQPDPRSAARRPPHAHVEGGRDRPDRGAARRDAHGRAPSSTPTTGTS